jgi:hypothetical protein
MKDGHAVTDAGQLRSGDVITTRMRSGEVKSIVE